VLWLTARLTLVQFAGLGGFRDEAVLAVLIVVGAVVYAGAILVLFGPKWLRSLVRRS
jgi:putative peptidoglycan lipid II flippase